MDRVRYETKLIRDLRDLYAHDRLSLRPWYQRNDIWQIPTKSYLIDTILRALPIPALLVRRQQHPTDDASVLEVVDGQQRLRAIIDFYEGAFAISKSHSEELGGKKWSDLPEGTRSRFLDYEISVGILEGASDQDVLQIYSRINSISTTLSEQEKRHAKYFGAFKTSCQERAFERLTYWRGARILTDNQIARMRDIELTSELVAAILEGLQDGGARVLNVFYKRYDASIPDAARVHREFDSTFDLIVDVWDLRLGETEFSREPLFYTLFLVLHDMVYGLGDEQPKYGRILKRAHAPLRGVVDDLSAAVAAKEPPAEQVPFVDAVRSTTQRIRQRRTRHNHLLAAFVDVLR